MQKFDKAGESLILRTFSKCVSFSERRNFYGTPFRLATFFDRVTQKVVADMTLALIYMAAMWRSSLVHW
jgi:hypothetical protein